MILVETPRLILRSLTEADAESLLAMDSDPEVMRYLGPSLYLDLDSQRQRIVTQFLPYYQKHPGLGYWAAEQKSDGAFVGGFLLRLGVDYRFAVEAGFTVNDLEVGWRLVRSAWGQGLATEAARAMVEEGIARREVERIVACALQENRASIHVMEKLGLQFVKTWLTPDTNQPSVTYALPRENFLQSI